MGTPTRLRGGGDARRQRLLSGSFDNVCVRLRRHLREHLNLHTKVFAVALPDNQHALSGSGLGDQTVKLFNVNDGAVLRTFTNHSGLVRSLRCARRPPLRQRLVRHTARIVEHGLHRESILNDYPQL